METKYTVTVDKAITRGMVLLVWIPLLLIVVTTGIGFLFYRYFEEFKLSFLFIIAGFLLGFGISWFWWSIEVVRWKIWAYSNVADIIRLEKKALRKKMIWRRGSWFEKTEIATNEQRTKLNELLERFNQTRIIEMIDDPRYFFEYTVGYSKIGLTIGVLGVLGALYLIIDGESIIVGVIGLIGVGWMLSGLLKKLIRNKFFLRVDDTRIILEGTRELIWSQITEYYVERKGGGKSSRDILVICGEDFIERRDLDDIDRGADFIEHLLEVYHSRYLQKSKRSL